MLRNEYSSIHTNLEAILRACDENEISRGVNCVVEEEVAEACLREEKEIFSERSS